MSLLIRLFGLLITLLAISWGTAALWFDGPGPEALRLGLVLSFATACPWAIYRAPSLAKGLIHANLAVLAVLIWWQTLAPSNDRDWDPSVARTPRITWEGDIMTVANVRNFRYRSEHDFDPAWETRRYDLSSISGVDLYLSYWGSPLIAHTVMAWTFVDQAPLAISIETRKEVGEDYSAVRGFFRQFELAYVLADEQDVIALRTNHRGEVVYRYPLPAGKAEARRLLEDYAVEVNRLAEQPDWYNALTHNCTTSIRHHIQAIDAGGAWDYRFLANGLLDEMMYERGVIDTTLPFAEVRAAHYITARAKAAGDDPSFSALIRLTAH